MEGDPRVGSPSIGAAILAQELAGSEDVLAPANAHGLMVVRRRLAGSESVRAVREFTRE